MEVTNVKHKVDPNVDLEHDVKRLNFTASDIAGWVGVEFLMISINGKQVAVINVSEFTKNL